jgi:uncharacterized protein (TIGR03083 family)
MSTALRRADPRAVARLYRDAKERITSLVEGLDEAGQQTPVPACPGWSVRDVVAHVTAVADEWGRGVLTGPPTDEQTAAQVARFDGQRLTDIIAAWTDATAHLCRLAEDSGLEPPIGDVVAHEHDIRGALGTPGARDTEAVRYTADRLLGSLRAPFPLRVAVEDAEYRTGPDDGPELRLQTTRFEALRWRTGRRSRAQLAAMDWSADPSPVLDRLCLFGPAQADLVE